MVYGLVRVINPHSEKENVKMVDNSKHPEKTINPTSNLSLNTPIIAMYPGQAEPTDEYLLFIKQIGLDTVMVMGLPEELRSVEGLLSIKKRYADAGIKVYSICGPISMQPKEIVLNMPGRDKLIEDYLDWIRTLGKAGIQYSNSGFMGGTGVWTTKWGDEASTRGAATREFNEVAPTITRFPPMLLGAPRIPIAPMPSFKVNKLAFGREYTRDEILENFTYFIKKVVPVAEEAGVCIGFHPDDPPGYQMMAGVARIFSNFESIKEVLQIANSPNIGIILCGGIWLEGDKRMGVDITEAIRWFVTNKKTWEFHFRNVSSPLPRFLETFPDNGYYDMYKVMKALVDIGYSGIVHLDHAPDIVGTPYTYPAYAVGYMKACLQRALAEAKIA
jgi:mannonate dehydratase